MALLYSIGFPRSALRIIPHTPPIPTPFPTGGEAAERVGGEYTYIAGVLHALYRSGGRVWLRMGEEDFVIPGPLPVRCASVSKDVLRTTIPLASGQILTVEELIPAWVHEDPTFDHLTAISTLWGCMVQDWLEDQESFHNRWGFARDLD